MLFYAHIKRLYSSIFPPRFSHSFCFGTKPFSLQLHEHESDVAGVSSNRHRSVSPFPTYSSNLLVLAILVPAPDQSNSNFNAAPHRTASHLTLSLHNGQHTGLRSLLRINETNLPATTGDKHCEIHNATLWDTVSVRTRTDSCLHGDRRSLERREVKASPRLQTNSFNCRVHRTWTLKVTDDRSASSVIGGRLRRVFAKHGFHQSINYQ